MASEYQAHRCISSCILLVGAVLLLSAGTGSSASCYKRIFTFGDSIIDTGNFLQMIGHNPSPIKEPPYGMTFFHHPTGRICDGRVLIDFYAEALGLPLIPPNLPNENSGLFPWGANFAVFAATALPPEYFRNKWNHTVPGSSCLSSQIGWFKDMLHRLAPGDATKTVLSESLIILGEIGGNDYNFWLMSRRPRDVAYQFIPDVVSIIINTAQVLINLGAKTIMIPGNFPIGCVPEYLEAFKTNNPADYDEFHCLKWFNDFSMRHNQALSNEISRLRAQHPGVKLIYADYFGANMEIFKNPHIFGIGDPLLTCCGGKGYGDGKPCDKNAILRGDPANFASWDGIHMTEKAYNGIADGVLRGKFAKPPLLYSC
ncbi:GDSL esterase/lipase At1g28590-like [Lolium perenne]|uniref:GDSL esterase/lipase At1g28590-like n=1 Tax=Lolium perenne TaxID=4522 RepID=UPI0021F65DCB|nr:GDSL esterase/lipase At1g28590-like [Lolium perenne]